jgi:hypothetical protein
MLGTRHSTSGTGPWSMLHRLRHIFPLSVTTIGVRSTEWCPDFASNKSIKPLSWVSYPNQNQLLLLPKWGSSLSIFKLKPSRLMMSSTPSGRYSGRVILESCTSLSPWVARKLQSRHSRKGIKTNIWQYSLSALSKKISRRQDSTSCQNSSKTQTYQMALRSSFQNMLSSLLKITSTIHISKARWLSFKF